MGRKIEQHESALHDWSVAIRQGLVLQAILTHRRI
jgi:hypothetical protein